ncbi:MAG: FAD-dependent oxidoreductase [Synergistaceae bacterium]|nr:NAD(P)/FAD-dependent oxidoreductase [Synergistota bacterium]NLM71740.1 FAD-dependent oxidoreductase [Synergistaceae bacterium]
MYPNLRSEGKIGRLVIPNRVVMPAMGVNLAAPDGGVTDDIIAFYEARARGGVGLIITEVTRVEGGRGSSDPCQLSAHKISDIAGLQRLTGAVHKYGTRIFIQLQHPGRMASPGVTGETSVAPSPVADPSTPDNVPRELTEAECAEMVGKFVFAAYVAKSAGADGVELHGAHGYLINEFLSPAMNYRTDRYGGSFENRMRFVEEIVAGIKRGCGAYFPVSVRINAEEALPGGIDLEEAARIAAALERAGADAINVSCYNLGCIEPGTYEQGWKSYMGAAIKKVVSIPVIAVNNIKDPSVAESLLEKGVCDFAGLGRALLADPEWAAKAFSGRDDEIRRCIGCLCCFAEIANVRQVRCAVNPRTGREREYLHPVRDGDGRVVAVIGGGPAGIEAALVLKERGFDPVIFDGAERLGGTLNTADKGYGKDKITKYVDSLVAQVEKAGIEVRLGQEVAPEDVAELKPCGVLLACGGEPCVPPVPGTDLDFVCTAEDVLLGRTRPTGRVVIIGSGMTGLETAETLALEGCKVTLVEMLGELGPGMYHLVVMDVMNRIGPHDPVILTGHRLERIVPGGVKLLRLSDGEMVEVNADGVVLAVGVAPRREVVDSFKTAFPDVVVIGDAKCCGRVLEATQDARGRAFTFEPRA